MWSCDSGSSAAGPSSTPTRRIRSLLLRPRRQRPSRRRTAEQRDELAPVHSITSSARASSDGGHGEAECLGGLEVDHQLEIGRQLDRQIGRLLAFEDAINIAGRATVLVEPIDPVGDQAAGGDIRAVGVGRGQFVPRRKSDDQIAMKVRQRAPRNNQATIRSACEGRRRRARSHRRRAR